MSELQLIATALSSIKTATEIVGFLRDSESCFERAEQKLKVAELVSALAEVKYELVELRDSFAEKEERIRELEEALETRHDLRRVGDAYYRVDGSGSPTGAAHCVRCWEDAHKQRQLVYEPKAETFRRCPSCGESYSAVETHDLNPAG